MLCSSKEIFAFFFLLFYSLQAASLFKVFVSTKYRAECNYFLSKALHGRWAVFVFMQKIMMPDGQTWTKEGKLFWGKEQKYTLRIYFFFWIEDSEGREASFFLFHQQMILISAEALSSDLRKFVPESLSLRVLWVWNYVYCVNFRRDCSFSETNTTLSFPESLFFPIHLSFLIGKWAHPFCHCLAASR